MDKKDLILYGSIAAGGYLAYWYVTNYGPYGVAGSNVMGQAAPSYWDVWFGEASTHPVVTSPQPGTTTVPAPGNTGTGLPAAPASTASLRDKLVAAAAGNVFMDAQGRLNGDQWNFYRNQLAPPALTADQMNQAFPNGAGQQLMTVDQFLAAITSAGLSGVYGAGNGGIGNIVTTEAIQSVPSPTFGGALGRQGNMRTMLTMGGAMKGPVN